MRIAKIICIGLILHSVAIADEPLSVVVRESSIQEVSSGVLRATFNLGTIPSNTAVACRLVLNNPSDLELTFDSVRTSCSCLNLEAKSKTIPGRGDLELGLTLTTPKRASGSKMATMLYLQYKGEPLVQLWFDYELAGMLCFKEQALCLTTAAENTEIAFDIPLVLSDPIRPEDVDVKGTGDLVGLEAKLNRKDGSFVLQCKLKLDAKAKERQSGELFVRDRKTGREDSIPAFIQVNPKVAVVPSILRLIADPESPVDSRIYRASAILRLNLDSNSLNENESYLIGCSSNVGSINSNARKIGSGIYRISIEYTKPKRKDSDQINGSKVEDEALKVEWEVKNRSAVMTAVNRAVLVEQ